MVIAQRNSRFSICSRKGRSTERAIFVRQMEEAVASLHESGYAFADYLAIAREVTGHWLLERRVGEMDSRCWLTGANALPQLDERFIYAAVIGINVVLRARHAQKARYGRWRVRNEWTTQHADMSQEMQQTPPCFIQQQRIDRTTATNFSCDRERALTACRRCRMHGILRVQERVRQAERLQCLHQLAPFLFIAWIDREHVVAVVEQRAAARMQIQQEIRARQQLMLDVMRNGLRRRT